MEKVAAGKKMKKRRRKKEKKEKKEGKKKGKRGKMKWKWGKFIKTWGKNRFFSYFFPKHLQISIFFPHNDIIMGKKYENILKYTKKFPRALRARKNLAGKKNDLGRGGGGNKWFFRKIYSPVQTITESEATIKVKIELILTKHYPISALSPLSFQWTCT